MNKEDIDWQMFLEYDPDSGVAKWKERDVSMFVSKRACSIWNKRFAGKVAGSIHTDGIGHQVMHVTILWRKYIAHRLFWEICNGAIPDGMTVDHIDQNPLNNKLSNLRLATQTDQHRNRPIQANNRSGIVGVGWSKKYKKWRARIGNGRSCIELGMYADINDAIFARREAEMNLGFHENHGLKVSPNFAAQLRAGSTEGGV